MESIVDRGNTIAEKQTLMHTLITEQKEKRDYIKQMKIQFENQEDN
jgi:hypothetical protein